MLYSQLTFVLVLAYLGFYIQFSIQQGCESHGGERDMFCQFVKKWQCFIIWAFDRGCKKIFKITLNHHDMQKLFMFSIILLFHPNNEERQNLKIEQTKRK